LKSLEKKNTMMMMMMTKEEEEEEEEEGICTIFSTKGFGPNEVAAAAAAAVVLPFWQRGLWHFESESNDLDSLLKLLYKSMSNRIHF
jgi:hypothetical protein